MTALCAWANATGLLPDIEPPRRIFLWLHVMHNFWSEAFKLHGVVMLAAIER
jgi:hypothetical protein